MDQPAHSSSRTPAPPIEGTSHVPLPVADLALAEAFYVDLLGAKLVRRMDRATFLQHRPERADEADADNSPLHLAVKLGDSPELQLFLQRKHTRRVPAPHPHLAFEIDHDNLDRFCTRLSRAGVPVDGPRRLGPPGHASIYFTDPWGQLLELGTMHYEGPVVQGPPQLDDLTYEWNSVSHSTNSSPAHP